MKGSQYIQRLKNDIFSKCAARGIEPNGLEQYFNGHWPRFEAQLEMFESHLGGESIRLVYDLGTGTPFTSYALHLDHGAEVVCGMPTEHPGEILPGVRLADWNLCYRPPADRAADLVICTECLEHLPCPLPPMAEYLKSLVRPGGYLLLSFPFGSRRASWAQDFGDYDRTRDDHLREFDPQLAKQFLRLIGWPIVADRLTYTSAYGGEIYNVLLRGSVMGQEIREPKVLITGSGGLLGGWILEEFRRQGTAHIGYDIKAGQDIFDEAKLRGALEGCTAVLHLAAYPDRGAAPNAEEFLRLNHGGALAAFKAAQKTGVSRFVYCSTGNVYCFGDGFQDDKRPPIEVTDTPLPNERVHPYPRSKLLTEAWLREFRGDLQVVVLRPNCLAPTPEPYFSQWRGATITQGRLARYFHNACVRKMPEDFVILDVIEPTPNYPGSLRAKELLD